VRILAFLEKLFNRLHGSFSFPATLRIQWATCDMVIQLQTGNIQVRKVVVYCLKLLPVGPCGRRKLPYCDKLLLISQLTNFYEMEKVINYKEVSCSVEVEQVIGNFFPW